MKSDKPLKICAIVSVILLALSLIPLIILGFYAHPVGDDYFYGFAAAKAFRESGNIFHALSEAAKGTMAEYFRWQGTYSAMFLMYLPPFVFSDFMYKLYPLILLSCLTFGIFYMLKPAITVNLNGSLSSWIIVSSLLTITFIEQVPLCGETFYWYNGSMYYTGFLALTFIFFGVILRFLNDRKLSRLAFLIPCALILAGGNYASLLPSILIICAFMVRFSIKKDKKIITGLAITLVFLLSGFIVSVIAPGNALRQDTSYKISAVMAILKSIRQCARYELYWNGIFTFAIFMILAVIFINLIKKCDYSFKFPILHCLMIFLTFCSSECPPFYAQNNGGAARLFDICFYMMILCTAFCEFYILGFIYRQCQKHKKNNDTRFLVCTEAGIVILFIFLLFVRPMNEANIIPNSIKAAKCLINGNASYYDLQYQERMDEVYSNPGGDLVFDSYDVPEDLWYFLHVGDLGDSSDQNNIAFSECYGLRSVVVK